MRRAGIGSKIQSKRNTRVCRDCLPDSGGLCLKGCGSCVTFPERPSKVRSSDVSPSPLPADGFTRHPALSARRQAQATRHLAHQEQPVWLFLLESANMADDGSYLLGRQRLVSRGVLRIAGQELGDVLV